jgi:hypothetical protein
MWNPWEELTDNPISNSELLDHSCSIPGMFISSANSFSVFLLIVCYVTITFESNTYISHFPFDFIFLR